MTLREIDALVDQLVMGGSGICSPEYTTCYADAWSVVERLRSEGYLIDLTEHARDEFAVEFQPTDEGKAVSHLADCLPSISLAICTAALATRGRMIDAGDLGVGAAIAYWWTNGAGVHGLHRRAGGNEEVLALIKQVGVEWIVFDTSTVNADRTGFAELGREKDFEAAREVAEKRWAVGSAELENWPGGLKASGEASRDNPASSADSVTVN